MSRVQLALNVADIDAAVDFYSTLFATRAPGSLNHLGIEVGSTDEVTAAQSRLAEAGLPTSVEDHVACCYAVQDKVWVDGPGGEPWEVYAVLADADVPGDIAGAGPGGAACCATRPDLASTATPTHCC